MWDHVRGNEVDADGRLKMGRPGFFDEVMRFYDQHLKGEKPKIADPALAVQTSDGSWRAETRWPPADARGYTSALKPGSYTDHGMNNGTEQGYPETGDGIWTVSPRAAHELHLAGVPSVALNVETQAPDANLVVDVYDLDASNNAMLISRGAYLVPKSGPVAFRLYGDDWVLKPDHRVGVLVTSSNAEWWMHRPTGQDVTVKSASITLPFLACARARTIEGRASIRLEKYTKSAPFAVDAKTVETATDPAFALPPAQASCANGRVLAKKVKRKRAAAKRKATKRHKARRHRRP
jgi:predicted acyl esterase